MSFWLHSFCGLWEGWNPEYRFHPTSWVDVATPIEQPKSLRNRCVIDIFGSAFCFELSRCFLNFSMGVLAFVKGLSRIVSFFLLQIKEMSTSMFEIQSEKLVLYLGYVSTWRCSLKRSWFEKTHYFLKTDTEYKWRHTLPTPFLHV